MLSRLEFLSRTVLLYFVCYCTVVPVDVKCTYGFAPIIEKRKKLTDVCAKKVKFQNKNGARKKAENFFCTHQYLYISE